MPLTRFKLSSIGDGGITSAKLADNIELSGTEAARMPTGTTAQRANPQTGDLRFNTTLDQLEQYTNASGWQGISAPPTISSIDIDNFDEADDPQTLVITGQNFDSTSSAALLNSSGTVVSPTTSTRNSSSQITIVFSGGDTITTDAGPYDVKVTNGSGLTAILEDALILDELPEWTTSAGSLGTVYEDEAISTISLSATDPEGESVSYSITSGALPTGLSLSSAGAITGTPNVDDTYNASGVTHNFTVTADDGTGNTTPRAFSILRKWYDGSSSALAAPSGQHIYDLGITTNGVYWIKPDNYSGSAVQLYVKNDVVGGGWMLVWKASRTLRAAGGSLSISDIMTTDAVDTAELQQNRIGDYHSRVSWDFMNKLAAMSNHRKAMMGLYDTPYGQYDSSYVFAQKLTSTGRGTSSGADTITDVAWDPWQVFFNRTHWTTVAQEGGLESTSQSNALGTINGNGTTFKFYGIGNTPGWDASNGLLTGSVSSSTPFSWEDNSISNFVASGTYASNIGNNGRFWKSRHSGALIGDVGGGDEWIYSTQTSFTTESTSTPAREIVFMK